MSGSEPAMMSLIVISQNYLTVYLLNIWYYFTLSLSLPYSLFIEQIHHNLKMEKRTTVIHWFRKGLRLHDNPNLQAAIDRLDGNSCLRPIFILDPDILKWLKVGINRWRFLQQSLENLNENLRKINSRLVVISGQKWTLNGFQFACLFSTKSIFL